MRRPAATVAVLGLALATVVAGTIVRLRLQEPLAALPHDPPGAARTVEERRERWHGRTLVHLEMRTATTGEARFVVSLPDPLPRGRIPLVAVLGGLRGGSRAIRQISQVVGDPGPNAYVGYDWPLPEDPTVRDIALHLPQLRHAALSVPGQVDAILEWGSRQPWADPGRVSLLGYSLGAFVVPAAQRLAEARGASVHSTILAYAGAPIGAVIARHPGVKPPWAAPLLGASAELLLRPIEPAEHLPHLHGRFLVLRARKDRLIASRAADRLTELTPQPRTMVVIEGDHMGVGPDRVKLLEQVVAISRTWLLGQGAIAPEESAWPSPARDRSAGSAGGGVSFPR